MVQKSGPEKLGRPRKLELRAGEARSLFECTKSGSRLAHCALELLYRARLPDELAVDPDIRECLETYRLNGQSAAKNRRPIPRRASAQSLDSGAPSPETRPPMPRRSSDRLVKFWMGKSGARKTVEERLEVYLASLSEHRRNPRRDAVMSEIRRRCARKKNYPLYEVSFGFRTLRRLTKFIQKQLAKSEPKMFANLSVKLVRSCLETIRLHRSEDNGETKREVRIVRSAKGVSKVDASRIRNLKKKKDRKWKNYCSTWDPKQPVERYLLIPVDEDYARSNPGPRGPAPPPAGRSVSTRRSSV